MEKITDYPNYMWTLVKQEYFHLNLITHYFTKVLVIVVCQSMEDSNRIKRYEV